LLVSYGATSLKSADAIQVRFVEVAKFGSLDELRNLVEMGARVNSPNRQRETALINALSSFLDRNDDYIKIMYLVDLGADVNLKGKAPIGSRMTTPLHQAIYVSSFLYKAKRETSYAERVLRDLLKKGAYVSATDEDGKTSLHNSAQYNHLYAAHLLLEAGSKVMPKDKQGRTPLDYAESAEMIKLLKRYGAKEQ
jgi:ankyrin repeat protein